LGYFAVPCGALRFAVAVTVAVNTQGGSCLFPTVCVMILWESCVWMACAFCFDKSLFGC
jgi:hypothetical protein